jgi:hypothetical protein
MTKIVTAVPEVIYIEPSKHLEAYIAGQPQMAEPYLVQIALFSELGGPNVTLSFTTQDDKAGGQGTAQGTSSFTMSVADARKLADAIRKAIGE